MEHTSQPSDATITNQPAYMRNGDDTSGIGFAVGDTTHHVKVIVDGVATVDATASTLALNAGAQTLAGTLSAANRLPKVQKVALAAVNTAGGVFSWQNPEASSVIACVMVNVTTPATGACTLDVGSTATNGTTLSDNLIDGVDIHTAAALFSSLTAADQGTNGLPQQLVASGKWITGSVASGLSAGLVGSAYICYFLI